MVEPVERARELAVGGEERGLLEAQRPFVGAGSGAREREGPAGPGGLAQVAAQAAEEHPQAEGTGVGVDRHLEQVRGLSTALGGRQGQRADLEGALRAGALEVGGELQGALELAERQVLVGPGEELLRVHPAP